MVPTTVVKWATTALASAGGEFNLMDVHVGTIFWTVIIFVLVALLLGKLAWKPILKAVADREKRIKAALEKADRVQEDAEKALAEQKAQMESQRKDAAEFLQKAKEDAQRSGAELLEKARKEASEMTDRARRQIDEEKNRAIQEVRSHAVDLALQAAGHLLGKTLDEESQRSIVRDYIDKLPGNLKQH
jgi:F-type H+-transporting ATPase subunit b